MCYTETIQRVACSNSYGSNINTFIGVVALRTRKCWMLLGVVWIGLVLAPRTSLERLLSKATALPCASEDRSERLLSYLIIIILYYKLLKFNYYIK